MSNGWEDLLSDMTFKMDMMFRRISYQIPRADKFWYVDIYYKSGGTLKFGWGCR